jgi:hypothetical protein
MSKTMTFTAGENSVTINRPMWGYTSEIHMPISVQPRAPSGYGFFDPPEAGTGNLGTFDYRLCTIVEQLPTAQKVALNAFFRDAGKGRCENVTLSLGNDPTGFFPFGPDLGDSGDFTVRMVGQEQGGMLFAPFKYFEDKITLVLIRGSTLPTYAIPAPIAQGNFQIGTLFGLLYPQNDFKPRSAYAMQTALSRTGDPFSVDGRAAGDAWETSFDQQCNAANAANLIALLVANRTTPINVIAPSDFYALGADQGASGTYSCNCLGSSHTKNEIVITVTHEHHNQFTIPLSFYSISTAEPAPSTISGLIDITKGAGVYVGIGYGADANKLYTSPDTVTWTLRKTLTSGNFTRVAFGNSTFAAVTDTGAIYTSALGETWALNDYNPGSKINAFIFSESKFFGGCEDGSWFGSDDGATFSTLISGTKSPYPITAVTLFTEDYVGLVWQAFYHNDSTSKIGYTVSAPGVSVFGNYDAIYDAHPNCSTNSGEWVACNEGICQPTLISSVSVEYPTEKKVYGICGTSIFVAVGEGGTIHLNNGSWAAQTSGTTQNLLCVIWDGSQFVAVGAGSKIGTSADGVTWVWHDGELA